MTEKFKYTCPKNVDATSKVYIYMADISSAISIKVAYLLIFSLESLHFPSLPYFTTITFIPP